MQTNDDAVRSVALRAKDIILAVARACEGSQIDIQTQLENDLKQLTECEYVLMAVIAMLTQKLQNHDPHSTFYAGSGLTQQIQKGSVQISGR